MRIYAQKEFLTLNIINVSFTAGEQEGLTMLFAHLQHSHWRGSVPALLSMQQDQFSFTLTRANSEFFWGPTGWDERRSRLKALRPGVSARKSVSDSGEVGPEEAGRWMRTFPHCSPHRRMQREPEGTRSSAAEPACCSHLLWSPMMGTGAGLPCRDTHVHRA